MWMGCGLTWTSVPTSVTASAIETRAQPHLHGLNIRGGTGDLWGNLTPGGHLTTSTTAALLNPSPPGHCRWRPPTLGASLITMLTIYMVSTIVSDHSQFSWLWDFDVMGDPKKVEGEGLKEGRGWLIRGRFRGKLHASTNIACHHVDVITSWAMIGVVVVLIVSGLENIIIDINVCRDFRGHFHLQSSCKYPSKPASFCPDTLKLPWKWVLCSSLEWWAPLKACSLILHI